MIASRTTSFANGVSNCNPLQAMAESGVPDPSFSQLFHDDFVKFTAADWTITNVGVTPTNALVSEVGGVLLNTTTTGISDATYLQLPAPSFQLIPGTHHFFKARLKMTNATACSVVAGLCSTSSTPISAADGLYFYKAPGAQTWALRHRLAGVTTDYPLGALNVVGNNTYAELSYHIDAQGNVEVFFNPTTGAFTQPPVGGPKGRILLVTPAITQALLTPTFGILNATTAALGLSIDYITMSSEL